MSKSYSQFDQGAGAKYAKKPEKRRTPSRPKQEARGVGFEKHANKMVESARKAMKRGRHRAPTAS